MTITSRKEEHVNNVLNGNMEYSRPTGLDSLTFIHNSLPEMSLYEVDTKTTLFGKRLSSPLAVAAMTGGYDKAKDINQRLAKACEEEQIAFFLGSQRAMIEKPKLAYTFKVRSLAPNVFVGGNIGVVQLKKLGTKKVQEALDNVEADCLCVHLNPLQELVQPEGDRDFRGCLPAIEQACKEISVPIIVKETGAGISGDVARRLKQAGVKMVDVSGVGGTSWSKVEYARGGSLVGFEEWGNPTAECVLECKAFLPVMATGGVRSGIDAAKCIALGAKIAGAASPFLKAKNPKEEIKIWKQQLSAVLLLTGSKNLKEFTTKKVLREI